MIHYLAEGGANKKQIIILLSTKHTHRHRHRQEKRTQGEEEGNSTFPDLEIWNCLSPLSSPPGLATRSEQALASQATAKKLVTT